MFSKTNYNAINIITFIATFGVIISSLALFVVLSGLSGLRTFSYNLLAVTEPDIKITSQKGKSFIITESFLNTIYDNTNIEEFTAVIEERVFLEYNNRNEIAYIKGVQENYTKINQVDATLYGGTWLNYEYENLAVIGNGISRKLNLGILFFFHFKKKWFNKNLILIEVHKNVLSLRCERLSYAFYVGVAKLIKHRCCNFCFSFLYCWRVNRII